ncbi:sugar O-acetyltransferase [Thalassotalea sp. PLHSN55]|uniref:sugar O-acetyltransferase n=1 Tax=Thalassotalea sp. PLHSN55 TaxID=3435888 RepID=UPI003F86D688
MSELTKMLAGEFYTPSDKQLGEMRSTARQLTYQYNQTTPSQISLRQNILTTLFAQVGSNVEIEPNFHCDYGSNIYLGDNFFANFGCVILDCATVTIGDNCLVGPQVGIYTACHPLNPEQRNSGVEFSKPITIGDNCWLGGHATINSGVSLGNNVVVASGAVVTKNFADNLVIAGNPAKVIKTLC